MPSAHGVTSPPPVLGATPDGATGADPHDRVLFLRAALKSVAKWICAHVTCAGGHATRGVLAATSRASGHGAQVDDH